MTDRELLERAARAAGIELVWSTEPGWAPKLKSQRMQSWNPLTDDGDALRLAVKLKLFPYPMLLGTCIGFDEGSELDIYEPLEPDPYAATRRAIVRAAAAFADQQKT